MKASALLGSLGLHLVAGTALVLLTHGAFEVHPRPMAVTLRHLVVPEPAVPRSVPEPVVPRVPQPISKAVTPQPAPVPAEAATAPPSPEPLPAQESEPAAPAPPGTQEPALPATAAEPAPAAPSAVVPPAVVSYRKPLYPPRLRSLGVEGSVVLEIAVSAQGTPQDVRVTRSSGYPEMDSRAVEALRRATYSPRAVGDTPVAGVLTLLVRYTLE